MMEINLKIHYDDKTDFLNLTVYDCMTNYVIEEQVKEYIDKIENERNVTVDDYEWEVECYV